MPRKRISTRRDSFRIIAGSWRGRRLQFVPGPGVRPTPDRVRETVFNWLQTTIHGARCLDLFAGSGALGLEALSRGAQSVTFVERAPAVAEGLRAQLSALNADAQVQALDAFAFLSSNTDTFDVVFLDPPFAERRAAEAFQALLASSILSIDARVYVETQADDFDAVLPDGWEFVKRSKAGQVAFGLAAQQSNN